eukprot:jgi/Orpsp1_1/1176598/evm.model.c7180000058251.1
MNKIQFYIQKTLWFFVTFVFFQKALADTNDCLILSKTFDILGLNNISEHYKNKAVVSPSCCDIQLKSMITCENINGENRVTK